MFFNFSLLFRGAYKALFKSRGTHARLTPRRIIILVTMAVLYALAETATWLGFLLDAIFFSGCRRQQVQQPIFIIGAPRSGTTYMHRLLAQDESRFTSMKAWEILFAPSVTQKKFFKALGALDSCCGSPLYRLARGIEKRLSKDLEGVHPSSLFDTDEDGHILLHSFSSAVAFVVLPFEEDYWPYFVFDQGLPEAQRRRIIEFYKRCVQNHLYVFGRGRQFLSKNPMFSTMVQTLDEVFPDAKFVYMARTPFETAPSTISLMSYYMSAMLSTLEQYPFLDRMLDLLLIFYCHPLEVFKHLPPERQHIIRYTDLVENPAKTVTDLCAAFGLQMNDAYTQLLEKKQGKAQKYTSTHAYSLEKMGITPAVIVQKYAPVFDRFGFDKNP